MNFTTPTTQEQMYSVLQEIFYYYRIRREADTGVSLTPLTLTRLTYTPMTATEIHLKAETAVKAAQELKLLNYKKELSDEIAELDLKIAAYGTQKEELKTSARENYDKAVLKAEREAVKKGIAQSSAVIDKIAALSTALSEELTEIDREYGDKISSAQSKKAVLNSSLLNADNYFSDVFGYEVAAKEQEIKDAEQKTITEIFKYNNGLDEKEQRYSNTIKTTTRELELRYMDIASDFFSKDELVEMGYYDDAINCVCSYYDTLSDVQAYQKLVKDRKVAIYLDDYYSNVLYMYKTRAGL